MRCRKLKADAAPRLALAALLAVVAGCRQDMHDQPKYEPLEATVLFDDGSSARPVVPGTVARGQLREDRAFFTGIAGDQFVEELPLEPTAELVARGRTRYDAFCSPCHGLQGDGLGMIVRRGFKQPTSLHDRRLHDTPVGYFFDVMTRGFGQMSSYAAQIQPADRWAIAAYVRALQLSRFTPAEALSPEDLRRLGEGEAATEESATEVE